AAGLTLRDGLAGLKVLLLNVSGAITDDVLIAFSPAEGPRVPNMTEVGKAGKIQLPREIFQALSSRTARVVVTVLNMQQLGMFEVNQTGQVLDDTVVGVMVGETSISRLRDPVQLTFAHGQLPRVSQLCPPSVSPPAGGWSSSGCVTQPRDKGTVCSCDHLTFFTLLLVTTLLPAAPAPSCSSSRCCPLGSFFPHCQLSMGTLGGRRSRRTHREVGGHLEPCHPALPFPLHIMSQQQPLFPLALVRPQWVPKPHLPRGQHVQADRLTHRLPFWPPPCVSLVLPGFPALVVGVAGVIGSYGQYSIQTTDHQVIAHLCWITSKYLLVHYITNCAYFGLIFLFNMAVFGVVTQKSCCLQGTGTVQGDRKAWKVVFVAMGLFCLLGATWALAFLTHGTSSAPVLYLFTILNSLQGIFIFIWLVVLYYPKTKETTGSLSHIIRHDKTTTASQD
ncbi:AGRG3 protein, partial [Nyctibius bracteatus]|nr:AGRG3 protein [Nyctibius bracteatus]